LAIALALLAAAACVRTQPFGKLTDDGEPFRARFNADAGHVRVVMLVAPT
jgi:hypothetical protein